MSNSELSKRILKNMKITTKKWQDAARNSDDVFNANNIKATTVNPTDTRFFPMDNSEKFLPNNSKVQEESYDIKEAEYKMSSGPISDKDIKDNSKITQQHVDQLSPTKIIKSLLNKYKKKEK